MTLDLEEALKIVRGSADHKVDERLPIITQYNEPPEGVLLKTGVALDTETTGLDNATDKIIEVALISFTYDEKGVIYDITDEYTGMEDPFEPLSVEVIGATGITDEDLVGKTIDKQRVQDILRSADLLIAHNSRFDRLLMDRTFGSDYTATWACSMNDIDWRKEGVPGKALSVVASHYNVFFDAHRAEMDVRATIHVVAQNNKEGEPNLKQLIVKSQAKTYEVWAFNAGFHSKDTLKKEGKFSWHAGDANYDKAWHKQADTLDDLRNEMDFLDKKVTPIGRSNFMVEEKGPELRFIEAKGKMMAADKIYGVLTQMAEGQSSSGPS